jgi:hypothetical protein
VKYVDIAWISLAVDARGEAALAYIPRRPSDAPECMIVADHTEHADAWTGTALRAAIEYHGRFRQKRVVLGLPRQGRAATVLAGLLDNDLPHHFCLSNDSTSVGAPPRNVILPSTVLWSPEEGDDAGDAVSDLGKAYARRPVRYISGAVSMLAELTFQRESPIGTICTVMHDRDENSLQLVMTDLGVSERSAPRDGEELTALATEEGVTEAVDWLVSQAGKLQLDIDIVLAAGAGRLRASEAGSTPSDSTDVEGFTAAVIVGL